MIFGLTNMQLGIIVGSIVLLLIVGGGLYWAYATGRLTGSRDPYAPLAKGLRKVRDDADALALLPYDDGTFYLKPCNFDKELIGGLGGYETEDGDKIALDGDGEPVKELLGVPIIMAVDPTEHASAVDPIKAYAAQKNNIGEWLKIDSKGNVIEVGEALTEATDSDIEIGPEHSDVVQEQIETMADGGVVSEVMYDRAVAELEKQSDIRKIYDLAPPAEPTVNEDGEVKLEEATHVAVDQSRAADLLPKTWDTTQLNTALDKARMEEYEEGKLTKYMLYGGVAVFIGETVLVALMFLAMQIA